MINALGVRARRPQASAPQAHNMLAEIYKILYILIYIAWWLFGFKRGCVAWKQQDCDQPTLSLLKNV
jgi:hypothetical protein